MIDFNEEQLKGQMVQTITNAIYNALCREDFKQWYETQFEQFIQGDLSSFGTDSKIVAETLVKQDIQQLFRI